MIKPQQACAQRAHSLGYTCIPSVGRKGTRPLEWVFPHMFKSTACGSGLHIWCQEQNKCSNTVFRRMTPFPEQALLPALCPLPANLWQLHVWPSPLEGTRGGGGQKGRFCAFILTWPPGRAHYWQVDKGGEQRRRKLCCWIRSGLHRPCQFHSQGPQVLHS